MADDETPPITNENDPEEQYNEIVASYQAQPASEKLAEAVRTAKPNWQTDGFGVKGPPKSFAEQDLASPEARFGNSFFHNTQHLAGQVVREPVQPDFPELPSEAGGTTTGTPVDIYGSLNGAPAVYHLLETAAPTSPPPLP